MGLLEGVLVGVTQGHDGAHVDLVEGREHGGRLLGLLQATGDGLPQPGHAHALLTGMGLARGGGCSRRRRGSSPGFEGGQGVGLGHASVLARAGDGGGIEPALRGDALGRRGQDRGSGSGGRSAGRGGRRLCRLGGCGRRSRSGCSGGRGSDGPFFQVSKDRARLDRGAFLGGDGLQDAVGGRGHLEADLVGLKLDEDLVLADRLPGLLGPARHSGLGDGLSEGGGHDVSHGRVLLFRRGLRPGRPGVRGCAGSSGRRRWRRRPGGPRSGRAWTLP